MPDDDLLTLLLGCGCRKRCCCGAPDPAPVQPATPLFGQAPRTVLPPRLPDETPFITTPGWYATGQRPSDFGVPHVPSNGLDGRPDLRAGTDSRPDVYIRDDGTVTALPDTTYVVDHQAREFRVTTGITNVTKYRLRSGNEQPDFGSISQGAPFWQTLNNGEWFLALAGTAFSSHNTRYTLRQRRVMPFATGTESWGVGQIVRSRPGQIVTVHYQDQQMRDLQIPPQPAQGVRLIASKLILEDGTERFHWQIEGLFSRAVPGDMAARWMRRGVAGWQPQIPVTDASASADEAFPFSPGELQALPARPVGTPGGVDAVSAEVQLVYGDLEDSPLPQFEDPVDRWISPDGLIRVHGPPTVDHARLGGPDTLITPAGAFAGPGWWAAYRRSEGGTVLLVQIEADASMTRVDILPDGTGTAQTVPLAQFAETHLRGQAWFGFSRAGPLHNTWPPHEALTRDSGGIDT
ncbi:hypothetical protein IHN63_01920 [Deinococcus sp. 6YEL10]|uniref:hypothetical protein n=1 Tax=Deinococcus sp. 6YEL10 TaxID=2745870 RepID=UPI001E2A4939|nr:hypothetical protein [Deinococcus sp. 6YEL10]MCD0160056.1 hypothetical protein [Deinococcus sp. 6YEL10]